MKVSSNLAAVWGGGVAATMGALALFHFAQAATTDGDAARLQRLEARQEIEEVDADHATAQSKGAYVIPNLQTHGAEIIFLVSYDDIFVHRNGHWLFQQRMLHAGIPAPTGK